jgi:RHS repeat-associated protein
VSGNIYAFVNPTTSVSQVRFYIDDPGMVHAPFRTDTAAPFDLAGSSGSNAMAFDTGTLSAGPHVITAAVTLTSGKTEVASAEFAARSGSPGTAWSYTYDSRSNRSSSTIDGKVTSFAYNAANQLTSSAGVNYTYDGAGNLTGASDGLALAYNTANQTTSITPAGGGAQSMAYAGTTQYERVSAGATTFSDNLLGLASRTTAGSATRTIRDNRGALLGQRSSAGSQYFLFDGLGSVVAVTNASGTVTDRYRYDPYGDTVAVTGASSNPWRYTGAFLDEATGLYKMGLRYYDPDLGRWTQQDAVQNLMQPPQANRYVYVGCNPANYVDPTGLSHCDASSTVAAGLIGLGSTLGASILIGGTIISGGILAPLTSAPSIGAGSIAIGSNILFLGCIHFPFFGE